jgi:hypothetical protein
MMLIRLEANFDVFQFIEAALFFPADTVHLGPKKARAPARVYPNDGAILRQPKCRSSGIGWAVAKMAGKV